MGRWLWLLVASSYFQAIARRGSSLFESCKEVLIAGKAAFFRSLSSWKSMEVSELVELLLEIIDTYLELVQPVI